MRAGRLRHPVMIQQRVGDDADFGHGTTVWQDLVAAWAGIVPLSADERASQQQVEAGVTHQITLRFRRDRPLTAEQRIVYGSRIFEIRGVINVDERDREWQVLAAEIPGIGDASGN